MAPALAHRLAVAAALLSALAGEAARAAEGVAPGPPAPTAEPAGRLVRDGVSVEFSFGSGDAPPLEGDTAEVRFRITDAASGAPVRGLNPAAWVDAAGALAGGAGGQAECREKVGLYLKGLVGIRPVADLNSYFLLVMNGDASLSVIDPVVGMTGKTSLYATVLFPRPPADWVRARDQKRLYVSLPLAGQVAAVDTETFKLAGTAAAGAAPTRVALQPDGRYLWVGNDASDPDRSGVTVLDPATLQPLKSIRTGRGHHELAFAGDSRRAFVTNRSDGTVSVVDVAGLEKVKDLRLGPAPISIAFSPLAGAIYVADGKEGKVSVVDPDTLAVTARIAAKPGLGPMRFTEDGRWGFVVNSTEHAVHVLEAGRTAVLHTVPLSGKPYQVSITRGFAYVRHLDTPRVDMVNLLSLGEGKAPIVTTFAAGTGGPRAAGDLSMADAITPAAGDAAVFVNDPSDGKTYFYMEGMNAPMGSFSGYGHRTRAVAVVDRSLREVAPGTYAGSVRLPEAGRYDVAFLLDNPRVLHCFAAEVRPNPVLASSRTATHVDYLDLPDVADAGQPVKLRVKLSDARTGAPRARVPDVRLTWYQPPSASRQTAVARESADGVYEAELTFPAAGAWYLQVTIPSLAAGPGEVPHRSLVVRAPPARAERTAGR